ncbi:MAG: type I DNA topoisomerase [Acidobacteria bacterium]|nr:type I DNA topoisomerase [Acidobacteriota bacterium]
MAKSAGTTTKEPKSQKGTTTKRVTAKAAAKSAVKSAKSAAPAAKADGRGKSLVIVESPAKAKTINRYLGSGYVVKASLGHVKDLPQKELGVDVEHDFRPTYEIIPSRTKIIGELKKAAGKAKAIYLAADPDREGEAICQHLAEELSNGKPIRRVLFQEITKNAIQEAFENPGEINSKLVDAQQARRILDRLVGYQISPLLWDKVRRGLSAGRVQTVALRLIVEREREIRAFQKEEYWTVDANLGAQSPPAFDALMIKRADQDFVTASEGESGNIAVQVQRGKLLIGSESDAQAVRAQLEKEKFVVVLTTTKERRRNAAAPFITSTLQQDASRKLGFSVKRTMALAQRLYEGVEFGDEGLVGLITYMRTDSTRVSDQALREVRNMVGSTYGGDYLPAEPNFFRGKKGAQDAHEAIRPTSAARTPDAVARYIGEDEAKLYRLIWQRFVASQMTPAVFDQTTIEIAAGEFAFRASGSVLKFDGFLKVYEEAKDQPDSEDTELGRKLPLVTEGEELRLLAIKPDQHFTEPPPRYNEASLVKELEKRGIGRPSTYASILSTIQQREYVTKQQRRFYPTELGMVVTDLLVENFDDIFDIAYTAKMEDALDGVEEGTQEWHEALSDFYTKFEKDLRRAEKHMEDIKRMEKPTELTCEKCGRPMVVKWGRHGSFLACSGYPDCTNTRELTVDLPDLNVADIPQEDPEHFCENCGRPMILKRGRFGQFLACTGYPDCKTTRQLGQAQKKPPVPIDENCPKCGSQMVIREGRFGEFTSCSNYPKCKYIKQKTMGVACPECGKGELVEKKSRWGKSFYSCDRYPKCKFSLKDKPVPQKCPQCDSAFLLEKTSKEGSSTLECQGCGHRQAA